jgi:hypothetical protein
MRLKFRHGIVRHQVDVAATATFLKKNGSDSSYIDLNCDNAPVIFTISHFGADYLFEETHSKAKAWGPMPPTGQTQYLYWDVSLLNAQISHGFSLYPPFISINPPANPNIDQHWFDMTNTAMKVWNGTKWIPKLRLFAGVYTSSAILTPKARGSQIGVNTECNAGNIILGKNSYPLRDSDGTFITSESNLIIANSSGEDVKFESALQFGQALEFIPEYSLVSFRQPLKLELASFMKTDTQVHGIIRRDASIGEIVKVISSGLVKNEQWDWTGHITKPIFCGLNGEVTLSPPPDGIHQLIGYIYDVDAIFLNILAPTRI